MTVIAGSLAVLVTVVGWRLASLDAAPPPIQPGHLTVATPPSSVHAGRLLLTFQIGQVGQYCSAMAAKLDFAVPCPGLLPTDATISGADCCIFSNSNVAPLFVLESHFTAPPGYPSAEPVPNEKGAHGHLLLIAMRRTVQSSALACASPQPRGSGPLVFGAPSNWQFCPGTLGGNAQHLILQWEIDGIDFSISLHGDTPDNRLAIRLMVLNLTLRGPNGF